jgi:16S rRNA (cytidine1402-2'-O)-methyltransferase
MDFYLKKKQALINVFNKISKFDETCVFFVSTKKVNKIIPDLKKYFSGRKIVFCREISKIYEEFMRKNVDDLELFNKELKGELTIVISEKKIDKNYSQKLSESDMNMINKMINKLTIKEIIEIISHNKDVSKKEIYSYCLKLKK